MSFCGGGRPAARGRLRPAERAPRRSPRPRGRRRAGAGTPGAGRRCSRPERHQNQSAPGGVQRLKRRQCRLVDLSIGCEGAVVIGGESLVIHGHEPPLPSSWPAAMRRRNRLCRRTASKGGAPETPTPERGSRAASGARPIRVPQDAVEWTTALLLAVAITLPPGAAGKRRGCAPRVRRSRVPRAPARVSCSRGGFPTSA